jgi:cytochrome P450
MLRAASLEYLVEIGLLVGLVTPELRAATSATYRRVFPADALRVGAAAAAYLLVVAVIALYHPTWLRIPAAVAAVMIAYHGWRARPGFGAAKGLPPGSLARLPVRPWSDPEFYKRQATRYGSIFKMCQLWQPMICIVGLDRVNRLLLEHDQRLVAPPLPFSRFIEGGYLRYLPEETHAKYRRFFGMLFYSEVVTHAEPRIADAFARGLAAMADASGRDGGVPVRAPTMRMMFVAWAELFYGIGDRHPDFQRLKALFQVIDTRKARWASRRRIEPALAEIEAILRRRASELVADPAPASCFLVWLGRQHPEALSDRTVLGNLIYIMQVTWGDVTGLLLWVFKMLSDHPTWRARLAHEQSRELAMRIVQETLRLEQSESRYRRATEDLELDGFRIPKDWLVRMCIRESHQDESVFPNATKFDPDRFLGPSRTRAQYAPFGAFRLACIGEDMTKTVAARYVLELASRYDWRVVDDGPPEITRWAHNAPNPRLSVRMTARPTTA